MPRIGVIEMDIKIFLDSQGRKLAKLTARFNSVNECLKYHADAKEMDVTKWSDEQTSEWNETTGIRWYESRYDRFGIDLKHFQE